MSVDHSLNAAGYLSQRASAYRLHITRAQPPVACCHYQNAASASIVFNGRAVYGAPRQRRLKSTTSSVVARAVFWSRVIMRLGHCRPLRRPVPGARASGGLQPARNPIHRIQCRSRCECRGCDAAAYGKLGIGCGGVSARWLGISVQAPDEVTTIPWPSTRNPRARTQRRTP